MKTLLNHWLSRFKVELHGASYIRKLEKAAAEKDPFRVQVEQGKDTRVIFDVGANRGTTTTRYRQLFPDATVHAFEPLPAFHGAFRQSHENDKRVVLVNQALSDVVTLSDFHVNRGPDTSSLLPSGKIGARSDRACQTVETITVATNTVDLYCAANGISRIDILKMDAQGAELQVLRGAQALLAAKRIGLIYTEAFFQEQYKAQPLFEDLAAFLRDFDYHVEDIYEPYYNQKFLLWCDVIFLPK